MDNEEDKEAKRHARLRAIYREADRIDGGHLLQHAVEDAERCSEPDPELLALRDEADAVAAPIMAKAEAVWSAHESEILKAFEERLREEEMSVDSLNEQHVSAGLDEEEINALMADLNRARDEADLNDAPILAEAERGWADIEWPEGAFTFINGDKK